MAADAQSSFHSLCATSHPRQFLSALMWICAHFGHVGFMPTIFAQGFVKPWEPSLGLSVPEKI